MEKIRLNSSIFQIPIINNVILYDETDSTNNRAKEFGSGGSVDGTLIISDTQTAGRGRLGRGFSSPAGTGIYMSLLLKPNINVQLVSQLTIIAALAVTKALNTISGIEPQIKWPNDIVINGRKIVGILTEMSCDTISLPKTYGLADMAYSTRSDSEYETNLKYVVVGIGINVNNEYFPTELKDTASSLYLNCGRRLDRGRIIMDVLSSFNEYYKQFLKYKNLAFAADEYNSLLASFNREVYIIPHDITISEPNPYLIDTKKLEPCICLGIDSHGDLMCRQSDGSLITVNSGEVSVRGLYGYSQ